MPSLSTNQRSVILPFIDNPKLSYNDKVVIKWRRKQQ